MSRDSSKYSGEGTPKLHQLLLLIELSRIHALHQGDCLYQARRSPSSTFSLTCRPLESGCFSTRLLNTSTIELHEFQDGSSTPDYAILCHAQGEEEVSLQDLQKAESKNRVGYMDVAIYKPK